MRFPLSPRLARLTRVSLLAFALGAGPVLAACGPRGAHPVVPSERKSPATPEVSDEGFASAVHDLLVSEPGSHERQVRLSGVESRQMARALAKFKARTPERGLAAVTGGMYLMRAGELSPAVLGPAGPEALKNAVRELSLKGDEGKARAGSTRSSRASRRTATRRTYARTSMRSRRGRRTPLLREAPSRARGGSSA